MRTNSTKGDNYFHQEFFFGNEQDQQAFFNRFGNRQQRKQRNKSEIKSHIFQGYKNVYPGLWAEISKEDILKDVGRVPKILDNVFYYVTKEGRDYCINPCFAAIIFYNHQENTFMYVREDGSMITEGNIFESAEEARNKLDEMFKKREGSIRSLIYPDGTTVKLQEPIYPPKNKKEEENKGETE